MARGYKKRSHKTRTRKPPSSSGRALFVYGGVLADWSQNSRTPKGRNPNDGNGKTKSASRSGKSDRGKGYGSRSESQKPRRNAFGYKYPMVGYKKGSLPNGGNDAENNFDESNPVVLVDSKDTQIVAYIDQTPATESQIAEFTYDCSTSFTLDDSSYRGLGYCAELEAIPSGTKSSFQMEEKEGSCFDSSYTEEGMDANVICTHDASTEMVYDFLAQNSSPEKDSGFLSIGGMKLYTQDISDGDCDEDDGVELSNEESLEFSGSGSSTGLSDSDCSQDTSDSDSDIDDEVAEDYFEGIGGSDGVVDIRQFVGQALDVSGDDRTSGGSFDGTLEKLGGIARREYGMKKPRSRRKYCAEASRPRTTGYAWSSILDDVMLVKDPRTISGRKKHVARFPRFWPSQAQKSKKIGKFPGEKKKHCKAKIALKQRERMVSRGVDLQQMNLVRKNHVRNRLKKAAKASGLSPLEKLQSAPSKSLKNSANNRGNSEASKKKRSGKTGSYAAQPVSFVSSGTMQSDTIEIRTIDDSNNTIDACQENKGVGSSSKYGAFELHTTGFGSKMMAKMGFIEGGGLGKGGLGIAEPIEAIQRPKSLGLGAEASQTKSNLSKTEPRKSGKDETQRFAGFEEYTKGFGSKMMAKMGFVEGMGLGKDSQGVVNPLVAVKLPKSRGLGSKEKNDSA